VEAQEASVVSWPMSSSTPQKPSMAPTYRIKKYSSRRLYDVQTGSFITLDELDRLVRRGETLEVVNAKGEDETRTTLLQLLTEREAGGEPLLSVQALHEIVRMYGHAMQTPFGRYLEEGLAVMRQQREAWQSSLPTSFREATQGVVDTLVSQSMDWVRAGQALWAPPPAEAEQRNDRAPERAKPRAKRRKKK
jgi:polyhydroxyalkanoate synthesis repressor PhaR